MLGSPNGFAWGFFLISHKAELGQKWIPKVRVFLAREDELDDERPDMLFFVEQSPNSKE
jgi:hypothetical protein